MGRVLPILFSTDMVQAILEGRKTVTRRVVKYKYSNTELKMRTDKYGTRLIEIQQDIEGETHGKHPDGRTWHKLLPYIEKNPPYRKGDILYVRETWQFLEELDGNEQVIEGTGRYYYAATDTIPFGTYVDSRGRTHESAPWRPSIHMPKEAARIWLKVTDVSVERLHDMTLDDFLSEGIGIRPESFNDPENAYMQARSEFARILDSTMRKSQTDLNPWVWVIEFKRCEKPEI